MANLEEMTLEELESAQQHLNAERAALKEQALIVQHEIDRRSTQIAAQARLDAMSEAEKAEMRRLLSE